MKTNKLYESIFVLHKCNTAINTLWRLIDKLDKGDNNEKLYATNLTYYLILESVSFLEEFNKHLYHIVESHHKEQIKKLRKVISPITKQIQKWTDLKKFRNEIIAHPWRDKNLNFKIADVSNYNIPRNMMEIMILVNLINDINNIIKFVFKDDLQNIHDYILKLEPLEKPLADYTALNQDLYQMAVTVNENISIAGYEYTYKVVLYKPED